MNDPAEFLVIIIAMLAIGALVVVFSGDPDMADGWRCKALEIPMNECEGENL